MELNCLCLLSFAITSSICVLHSQFNVATVVRSAKEKHFNQGSRTSLVFIVLVFLCYCMYLNPSSYLQWRFETNNCCGIQASRKMPTEEEGPSSYPIWMANINKSMLLDRKLHAHLAVILYRSYHSLHMGN